MSKPRQSSNPVKPMVAALAVQLNGVLGTQQQASDVVLTGTYERDREACEAAIRRCQAVLDDAGENIDPKANDFDLAWAWHNLLDAYLQLARLEARTRLARRRVELRVLARLRALELESRRH